MKKIQMTETRGQRSSFAWDAFWLAVITILSALPYISRIGFYSDDWSLLADFHFWSRDGRFNLLQVVQVFEGRPVHGLYLALLYELFGLDPPGYHLVNTGVIAACVPLFYLLLSRLGVSRLESFGAAVLLVVLPQLSTVRVWVSAAQIPLGMLFALLSLHAQLSFIRSGRRPWLAAAAVGAVLSMAAYETFAPLVAGLPLSLTILWRRARDERWRRAAATAGLIAALFLLAILLKLLVTTRSDVTMQLSSHLFRAYQFFRPGYDWQTDYGLNIFAIVSVHFWQVLVAWVRSVASLVIGHVTQTTAFVAVVLASIAFVRMRRAGPDSESLRPYSLVALGLITFVLGHATFLLVSSIQLSPAGMGNRALVAAAPGVAMMVAAGIGLFARTMPRRSRRDAFAALVGLLTAAGACRVAYVAGHWVEASREQLRILASARADLSAIPAVSTVILDGICPYRGPGVVFEAWWDWRGALSLALERRLDGDVITPRMSAIARGLQSSVYGERRFYAYGPSLFIYDPAQRLVVRLTGPEAARDYFSRRRHVNCPVGYVGHGVPI